MWIYANWSPPATQEQPHNDSKLQSCARRDWGLAWGRMLSHGSPYCRRNNVGQICSWQTAPHLVKLLRYSLGQDSLVCSLVNSGLILAKAHSALVWWLGAELPSSWISCRQDSGCHHDALKSIHATNEPAAICWWKAVSYSSQPYSLGLQAIWRIIIPLCIRLWWWFP